LLTENPLAIAQLRSEIKGWGKLGIELTIPQFAEVESADEALAD
jgi:hypothetical protein